MIRISQKYRDSLIKWGLVAIAVVIALLLLAGGIASWQEEKYRKKVSDLEQKVWQAEAEAKEHERQAELLKDAIEVKYGEIQVIRERASAAEAALRNAKAKTITLKEEYETIRYLPMPVGDVSCAELRAELAGLGYK